MTTPLIWKACEFCEYSYGLLLYRSLSKLDVKKERYTVYTDQKRLIPLYISYIVLIITQSLSSYLILGWILDPNALSLKLLLLYLAVVCMIALGMCLNLIIMKNVHELHGSIDQLFALEVKLSSTQETRIRKEEKKLGHLSLFKREFQKIASGNFDLDWFGILIYGLVIELLLAGIFLAPIAIYKNFDPGYRIIKNYNLSYLTRFILGILRYIITQWGSLELTRTFARILISTIVYIIVHIECLRRVKLMECRTESLVYYKQLRCIVQIGDQPIRWMSVVMIFFGLVGCIISNTVVIEGLTFLPLEIYWLFCMIDFVTYMIIYVGLPLVTDCYEFSKILKTHIWGRIGFDEFCKGTKEKFVRKKEFQAWRKSVKAQRPIAFYYGFARFERDTKATIFENIVLYTSDVLLLME